MFPVGLVGGRGIFGRLDERPGPLTSADRADARRPDSSPASRSCLPPRGPDQGSIHLRGTTLG